MTKSLSYRIAAISMALLMLLYSTGFTIDAHYCQDELMGISFFGKAKSCCSIQETGPCHETKVNYQDEGVSQINKLNCCHNENIGIEKSDLDATGPQMITIDDTQLDFEDAFVTTYLFSYDVKADYQVFDQYKPPLPNRDFQILYQNFLI